MEHSHILLSGVATSLDADKILAVEILTECSQIYVQNKEKQLF
jgi:hypothetical protein